jgi:Response regulator containing CheY-like receiver domain and AraC-type DNA-binding domain
MDVGSTYFRKFIASYLAILAGALVLGNIAFWRASDLVERRAIAQARASISQAMRLFDARFAEVEGMALQVSRMPGVVSFMENRELADSDYVKLLELQRSMPPFQLTNKFVANYYVYFRNSRAIASPSFASARFDALYGAAFRFEGIDSRAWESSIEGRVWRGDALPARPMSSDASTTRIVAWIRSIPSGYRTSKAETVFLLNDGEFRAALGPGIDEGGWYCVQDRSGSIISAGNSRGPLDPGTFSFMKIDDAGVSSSPLSREVVESGRKMFRITARSDYNGWSYRVSIPRSVVLADVDSARLFASIIVAITFLLGLALSAYLARRNARPVMRLAASVDYLTEEAERQAPLVAAAFLDRLYRSGFPRLADAESGADDARVALPSSQGRVATVRVFPSEGGRPPEAARAAVLELASGLGATALHPIGVDKAAFVIPESLDPCALAACLVDACANSYGVETIVGVGGRFEDALGIKSACDAAWEALEFAILSGASVASTSDLPSCASGYRFSLDDESRLTTLISMGDRDEAGRLIGEIRAANFSSSDVPPALLGELAAELSGCVHKFWFRASADAASRDRAIDAFRQRFESSESARGRFDTAACELLSLCDLVASTKRSHNEGLRDGISAYVSKNFADPLLCLAKVADEFGLSEGYLSRFYKEQVGISFSDDLERIRMGAALELLEEGRLPIEHIVENVGYTNSNTFYKAFKRCFGVSPRAYADSREARTTDKDKASAARPEE